MGETAFLSLDPRVGIVDARRPQKSPRMCRKYVTIKADQTRAAKTAPRALIPQKLAGHLQRPVKTPAITVKDALPPIRMLAWRRSRYRASMEQHDSEARPQ